MRVSSLYKTVAAAGKIVQVTTDRTIKAHKVEFSGITTETGKIFVGSSALVASTYVGVFSMLWPTGGSGAQPNKYVVEAPAEDGNVITLADFWIDAAVNGEHCLVVWYED